MAMTIITIIMIIIAIIMGRIIVMIDIATFMSLKESYYSHY